MKSLKEIVDMAFSEKEIQIGKRDIRAIRGFVTVLTLVVGITCLVLVLGH